jgi:uncharacterized membrane protein
VRNDTKIAAAVFAAIPLTILSAAFATTWVIAHGASMKLRLLFRVMCHGIPSRCLTIWDVPMPICARCTAIYAGLFAGIVLLIALLAAGSRFSGATERWFRWTAIVAAMPVFIDGVTQAAGLRESTNPLRLATGLVAGFFFGIWVLCAIETAPREPSHRLDAV